LLIDYYPDSKILENLLDELYNHNWESFYYSTQAKNNAFMAFAKYLQKTNLDTNISYKYSI
jgi:hypothetical protein